MTNLPGAGDGASSTATPTSTCRTSGQRFGRCLTASWIRCASAGSPSPPRQRVHTRNSRVAVSGGLPAERPTSSTCSVAGRAPGRSASESTIRSRTRRSPSTPMVSLSRSGRKRVERALSSSSWSLIDSTASLTASRRSAVVPAAWSESWMASFTAPALPPSSGSRMTVAYPASRSSATSGGVSPTGSGIE